MKRLVLMVLAVLVPVWADPTVAGRAVVGKNRAGAVRGANVTGKHGGKYRGASGSYVGPKGAAHFHVGSATGPHGGTTSVRRGFAGNKQQCVMGRSRVWNGQRSSGSLHGHTTWNHGTVRSNGSLTVTNKKTGATHTDTESVDYNKQTGGDATVTTPKGTKTETLPPRQ